MGIEISEEKRAFKTTSVVFLLMSVAILGLFISKAISGSHGQSEKAMLQQKAQIVGLQVMQIYFDQRQLMHQAPAQLESTGGRGIASVKESIGTSNFPLEGQMGTDLWGQPFLYKIQESDRPGENGRIFIYSKGEKISQVVGSNESYELVLDIPIPST